MTLEDGRSRDEVGSYFGMRSIGVRDVAGFPKLVLNGEPVFSLAMLDQGFWPDGLNTAPSDEALAWDIKAQKDLGFNALRLALRFASTYLGQSWLGVLNLLAGDLYFVSLLLSYAPILAWSMSTGRSRYD